MQVAVLGAGPGGLYCAYLLKRWRPDARITVVEQNPADATFGFGVVFSERALEFLRKDDPETHDAITPHLEVWDDITLFHKGEAIRIDGMGFSAIGRLALLQLLQDRVRSVGVAPVYERRVDDLAAFGDADLVIAADGANSLVRRTFRHEFGTSVEELTNRFAWFGTTQRFDTLSHTFRATPQGCFNAHHYRYAPGMSTFVVEVDAESFARIGLDAMDHAAARAYCEDVFADTLQGHPLVSNNSVWRRFPKVSNQRWWHERYVLVGDALRTAHFSIGSGTRLAMEDAIALVAALRAHPGSLVDAYAAYEAARRPVVEKLVAGANASAAWYEDFPKHMSLAPLDFAMSYITRSGRVERDKLARAAPDFIARYERARPRAAQG